MEDEAEGFARVRQSGQSSVHSKVKEKLDGAQQEKPFVFLGYSDAIAHQAGLQPCDIAHLPAASLPPVEYGIATPAGSPLRVKLNHAVLKLKETGYMERLQEKWWPERSHCTGVRRDKVSPGEEGAEPSSGGFLFQRQMGELVLLLVGIGISIVVAALEYSMRKNNTGMKPGGALEHNNGNNGGVGGNPFPPPHALHNNK